MGISKRHLEKLAEKINANGDLEEMDADFEGLTDRQAEDLARAIIKNRYRNERDLDELPDTTEVESDLRDQYMKRLEGLKAELFEKFGTKKD